MVRAEMPAPRPAGWTTAIRPHPHLLNSPIRRGHLASVGRQSSPDRWRLTPIRPSCRISRPYCGYEISPAHDGSMANAVWLIWPLARPLDLGHTPSRCLSTIGHRVTRSCAVGRCSSTSPGVASDEYGWRRGSSRRVSWAIWPRSACRSSSSRACSRCSCPAHPKQQPSHRLIRCGR